MTALGLFRRLAAVVVAIGAIHRCQDGAGDYDLINVAGTASFVVEQDAEPLVVKITWVIVREDGDWKIVSHHVSSKTPLIAQ